MHEQQPIHTEHWEDKNFEAAGPAGSQPWDPFAPRRLARHMQ